MNEEDLIEQFCAVAGTAKEQAHFYLESANWKLPLALSSFFDSSTSDAEGRTNITRSEDEITSSLSLSPNTESIPSKISKITKSKQKPSRTSNIGSIRNFEEDEDQDNEDESQRFYAGGSEHSGELIVGPPRKKQTNDDITENLFREAKKHGAEVVDSSNAGKSVDSKPNYFSGGGYKLGEAKGASQFIPNEEEKTYRQAVNVVLKLWSNGFTVDDGPLREFNDPTNEDFLNSIRKGEIPRELMRDAHGGEVHVNMEDHRREEFKAPKKKLAAFSGHGYVLGSPTPQVSLNSSKTAVKLSSSVDPPVIIDRKKPTTLLQIRLSNGRKLRQEFNQTHRISDIRNLIVNSNPDLSSRPFVLMTTFPNKELTDETLTLTDAKLLNALVVQKLL